MTQDEEGARGRKWGVGLGGMAFGVVVLSFGLLDHYDPAVYAGVVLVIVFGAIAAGARKIGASAGPVHGEADFKAPPPPGEPSSRKLYLPRGWRSKPKP